MLGLLVCEHGEILNGHEKIATLDIQGIRSLNPESAKSTAKLERCIA